VQGRLRALAGFARANPLVAPLGGIASAGSYVIALWAMTRAPVAAVAPIACGAIAMRLA
jgi:hypothetical protein